MITAYDEHELDEVASWYSRCGDRTPNFWKHSAAVIIVGATLTAAIKTVNPRLRQSATAGCAGRIYGRTPIPSNVPLDAESPRIQYGKDEWIFRATR